MPGNYEKAHCLHELECLFLARQSQTNNKPNEKDDHFIFCSADIISFR